MPDAPTRIAIAVVEQNGLFLVGERAAGKSLAGCAEFPGGRVEAGVRLRGKGQTGGSMELFVGGEQMIDADVLDRLPRRWAYLGFRLLGH